MTPLLAGQATTMLDKVPLPVTKKIKTANYNRPW